MSQKELALQALSRLPETCSFEEMAEKLRFLAGIQVGLDELDQALELTIRKSKGNWLHGCPPDLVASGRE